MKTMSTAILSLVDDVDHILRNKTLQAKKLRNIGILASTIRHMCGTALKWHPWSLEKDKKS